MYASQTRLVSSALLAVALAGCVEAAPWVTRLTVTEIGSPASDGSGEPFVSSAEDGVYMSWLEAVEGDDQALKVSRLSGDGAWSEPVTVATSTSFFVNWADFPSVRADASGNLWAHWLQRGGTSTYDYGVRVVHSPDGGATWSEPWTPHTDGTPTEHGFVSAVPLNGGMGFFWLDGRETLGGHEGDGHSARGAMTVRFREASAAGDPGPEMLVDESVCDCCQTAAALTPSGPVVVYRDRSPEEIRDIYIARWIDGAWTEGQPVHRDGWEIAGCPVNGPAVAAVGEMLAVAWFTAADDVPRVKVAFSADGGATFGAPIVIDDGDPAGRVDLVELPNGEAGVLWLERTGGQGADVRLKSVAPNGTVSPPVTVSQSSAARASGFARAALTPDGALVVAWTDATESPMRVRVTKLSLEDR